MNETFLNQIRDIEASYDRVSDNFIYVFLDEPKTGLFIYHVSYQTEDDISTYAYGIDLNAEDGSLVDTSDICL